MTDSITRHVTCAGCGCLCDDIDVHTQDGRIVETRQACPLGESWFAGFGIASDVPPALIHGQPAGFDQAIARAKQILTAAKMPLIFGMGHSSCDAQREAVALAEQVGAVIDSHTSLTHGPTKIGVQLVGKLTCTLGEIKNRTDLIVLWGTNPVESHPRHLSRYVLDPPGKFVPRGRRDRSLIVVDVRDTPTAAEADLFVPIRPGQDFEALSCLRALLKGKRVDSQKLADTGMSLEVAQQLLSRMKRARHGVLFFGSGLVMTRGRHVNAAAALGLATDLCAHTKFLAMPMRDLANESGADKIFAWTTGYPYGVDFTRGYSRSNPGEFTAIDLLARGETDAALLIDVDPEETMPTAAIDQLAKIPTIAIGARATKHPATVAITTSVAGIHSAGMMYRMDKLPISLTKVTSSPHPTCEEVLQHLAKSL